MRSAMQVGTIRMGLLVAALLSVPGSGLAQEIRVPYARGGGVAGVPDFHIVQPGDTLFDLSAWYYSNPFQWPRVWSYNPQISNPHWIYPGDIVFLRPAASAEDRPARRPPGAPGTHYALGGFYTGEEQESVGYIRFSPNPYRMLSLYDDVYVEFDNDGAVNVGDRFALNRVLDRVYDDDDEIVAVKYLVTGVVEVTDTPAAEGELWTGRIIQAWDVIERGDLMFLNQRHIRIIERQPGVTSLEGEILDFLEPTHYAAETWYVFVDAGSDHGVREGNVFTVWDRSDEYVEWQDREEGYEDEDGSEDIPWRPVGEAVVIFTTAEFSTCVVTNARIELNRHMRVTITEGF